MTEAEGAIKEDKSIWDQLMELKVFTIRTGVIHESQVMQLKIWANLLFNCPTEIQIVVEGDPSVTFIPQFSKTVDENNCKGLSRSTQSLLGDQFSVLVKRPNNDVIFSSYGTKVSPKQLKLIHD